MSKQICTIRVKKLTKCADCRAYFGIFREKFGFRKNFCFVRLSELNYGVAMDRTIEAAIAHLRRDGRASYSDLARTLGVSRAALAKKLGPLFDNGSLRVIAAVHPRLLGREVLAHASIRVAGSLEPIEAVITELSTPVFVSETAGQFNLVCELHAHDFTELQNDLDLLRRAPGVETVEILLYERILSSFFLGPEPQQLEYGFDDDDLKIVSLLQNDGRMSFSDIADHLGVSVNAARNRVTRLLETGAMQIGVVRGRNSAGTELVFGFGIRLGGEEKPVLDALHAYAGIEFLARTVGRYSIVATLSFSSLTEYNRFLGELRDMADIHSIDTWLHAKIRMERYHHGTHATEA